MLKGQNHANFFIGGQCSPCPPSGTCLLNLHPFGKPKISGSSFNFVFFLHSSTKLHRVVETGSDLFPGLVFFRYYFAEVKLSMLFSITLHLPPTLIAF